MTSGYPAVYILGSEEVGSVLAVDVDWSTVNDFWGGELLAKVC